MLVNYCRDGSQIHGADILFCAHHMLSQESNALWWLCKAEEKLHRQIRSRKSWDLRLSQVVQSLILANLGLLFVSFPSCGSQFWWSNDGRRRHHGRICERDDKSIQRSEEDSPKACLQGANTKYDPSVPQQLWESWDYTGGGWAGGRGEGGGVGVSAHHTA